MAKRNLVIVGDGEFAQIAFDYFTRDSEYEVAAFAVERAFLKQHELFGLPVVAFEDVESLFPPATHDAFVAITSTQLNRVRTRLYHAAKAKGYTLATYVSSRSMVWHNASIGENCFLFEANVVQYHASIGNNVVLWSANHIGHRTVVAENCFFAAHVIVSGFCTIGASSFLGSNATLGDHVTVGSDCVIGAGAVVLKDVPPRQVMRGNPAVHAGVDSLRVMGVKGE